MKLPPSKIGFLLGLFILVLTIPFAVYLATQRERTTSLFSRAELTGPALLYLWPAALEIPKCSPNLPLSSCPKSKMQIILDTKEAVSGGADIVLKYDPRVLRVVDNKIFPGSVSSELLPLVKVFDYYREGEVDGRSGIIKIKARGSFEGERGVVATFFINGLAEGETKMEFVTGEGEASKVLDSREENNILGGIEGGVVKIK